MWKSIFSEGRQVINDLDVYNNFIRGLQVPFKVSDYMALDGIRNCDWYDEKDMTFYHTLNMGPVTDSVQW